MEIGVGKNEINIGAGIELTHNEIDEFEIR